MEHESRPSQKRHGRDAAASRPPAWPGLEGLGTDACSLPRKDRRRLAGDLTKGRFYYHLLLSWCSQRDPGVHALPLILVSRWSRHSAQSRARLSALCVGGSLALRRARGAGRPIRCCRYSSRCSCSLPSSRSTRSTRCCCDWRSSWSRRRSWSSWPCRCSWQCRRSHEVHPSVAEAGWGRGG
jgi:hypothetical protein